MWMGRPQSHQHWVIKESPHGLDSQVRSIFELLLHVALVDVPIDLGAGALDGFPLGLVQHLELEGRDV